MSVAWRTVYVWALALARFFVPDLFKTWTWCAESLEYRVDAFALASFEIESEWKIAAGAIACFAFAAAIGRVEVWSWKNTFILLHIAVTAASVSIEGWCCWVTIGVTQCRWTDTAATI